MKKTIKLLLIGIISILAGTGFIVYPETVPDWIIRFIGITWILEGVNKLLEIYTNWLKGNLK